MGAQIAQHALSKQHTKEYQILCPPHLLLIVQFNCFAACGKFQLKSRAPKGCVYVYIISVWLCICVCVCLRLYVCSYTICPSLAYFFHTISHPLCNSDRLQRPASPGVCVYTDYCISVRERVVRLCSRLLQPYLPACNWLDF